MGICLILILTNIKMNNLLFSKMTDKTIPVICTNHAIKRAIQRCKLLMHKHEKENPYLFLMDIYKKTTPDMSVVFSPFAYNKMCSTYGPNSFVRCNDKFMLMCRYDAIERRIVIKSVIYKRENKFYF